MSSHKLYNEVANKRTAERARRKNLAGWGAKTAAEAEKVVPRLSNDTNLHICMIVGYNEKTRELAVSDSWGPSYELRWINIDIAKAVTTRGGFVIDL